MKHRDANPLYRLALNSCEDTPASSQASGSYSNHDTTLRSTVANFSQISLTQTDAILVDSSVYHQ